MKKSNKENPITFFRKANEARQAVVKKSIKKAQDGIEMNDDMINKPGYGEKKNVYVRPEPTLAAKNTVYQGPISEIAAEEIQRSTRINPNMTNFNTVRTKNIENASRNPSNSKIQEKNNWLNPKVTKEESKAYKKDFKNLPKNSQQKKDRRKNVIVGAAAEAVAAPFLTKFLVKNWNLPKKKGGSVKYKTGGTTKTTKIVGSKNGKK